ncbi:putative uncharacterized protein [Brachyspira sp. CAG:484]|nr:putative uncharacterized protein [Brachyspira sp. CAG:484]
MLVKEFAKKVFFIIKKGFFLTLGAFTAGFAIDTFLAPNNIIDGGIVGVSMILSYLLKYNLGLLLIILNIPFICLAFTKMGKYFVIQTFYAILMFAIATNIFHSITITNDLLLATVFGGIILGTGVGIVLKNEGSLDGTEIMSLVISKKFGLSVGEIIMGINIFIYAASGLVFGWEKAMYSILTYFLASRVIDVVLEGVSNSKSVRIISDKWEEIGNVLIKDLEIGVTYLHGTGGYSGDAKTIIYCVVSRIEMSKMKEAIKAIDPRAFISVVDVHEAYGIRMGKRIDKI